MGLLIDGRWHDQWYDTKSTGGAFKRQESAFRDQVTADGSSGFKAEPGRYHLYISLACPWAHRTLIFRKLKKLDDAISVSVVEPLMLENGWELAPGADPVNGKRFLYEVYTEVKPDMSGRVTVPVLWDKQKRTIVNNESAEIIRMLNTEFNAFGDPSSDYYPADLRGEIDEINAYVYDRVNNGVYKAGFATDQTVYERAFDQLFEALDALEERLGRQRYLAGDRLTEADWRLFTTLVRFDAVYVGHFKCNLRRIEDYPNLSNYLRELYQVDGVADTVSFEHIKRHYYGSHKTINPTGIVPKGPALDYGAPHDRDRS
ncbi:glutathione S-transferase family protein [Skermanella sp. TT6]|uniref:Glutathione S-transferase family protein n=1 Tax=Skermanella cutis TaxID=2775420 RepID=A0ABX7BAK8_9PROT|nr:glutathione S-transferase family protein [Skermanella sp. TT6]QQP91435.1 glutathione S-transferase family protein [Skermanella sp. TT6]